MVTPGHPQAQPTPWWRTEARAIILLAIPLILTNFAHVALTTIDIVVLGTLGAREPQPAAWPSCSSTSCAQWAQAW